MDDRAWSDMNRLQKGIWHGPLSWLKKCKVMFEIAENMQKVLGGVWKNGIQN